MRRTVLFFVLSGVGLLTPASAQDHVAVGAFVDYFRLDKTDTNFAGLGGRLGVGLSSHVMLEGEMSYDFNQVFNESFSNGSTVTVERSNLRLLHGLFGPKVALGHSNFHPFVTLKGGFLNTRFDSAPGWRKASRPHSTSGSSSTTSCFRHLPPVRRTPTGSPTRHSERWLTA